MPWFCGALILCLTSVATAADDWQRILCIDDPQLAVTLLLKRSATAADVDFVGLQLINRTAGPLKLGQASS